MAARKSFHRRWMLRDIPRTYVLLVWLAFGTAILIYSNDWRPIGWTALLVMVATGAPLASHVLPDSDGAAKAVFTVKMCLFLALLVVAYLHDFVLGPKVAREIREGLQPKTRPRLVVVGWVSFTLTVTIPILGVVLAEIA